MDIITIIFIIVVVVVLYVAIVSFIGDILGKGDRMAKEHLEHIIEEETCNLCGQVIVHDEDCPCVRRIGLDPALEDLDFVDIKVCGQCKVIIDPVSGDCGCDDHPEGTEMLSTCQTCHQVIHPEFGCWCKE